MEPLHIALLLVTGLAAGFVNVLAGGGSLLTLPVMILLGIDAPSANGANRLALIAQNGFATAGFHRQGYSDVKLSASLALCTLPGALVGAFLGTRFGGPWFNRILGVIMLAVLAWMMFSRFHKTGGNRAGGHPPTRARTIAAHALIAVCGLYGGFLQAGIGFVIMPILQRVLGLDLVRVNMHKVIIIGVFSLLSLSVFAATGHVAWTAGLWLSAGNAAGGWIGSHVAVKKGERLIVAVYYITIILLSARLLLA